MIQINLYTSCTFDKNLLGGIVRVKLQLKTKCCLTRAWLRDKFHFTCTMLWQRFWELSWKRTNPKLILSVNKLLTVTCTIKVLREQLWLIFHTKITCNAHLSFEYLSPIEGCPVGSELSWCLYQPWKCVKRGKDFWQVGV